MQNVQEGSGWLTRLNLDLGEYNWERWEIESRLCLWKERLILTCSWLREKQEFMGSRTTVSHGLIPSWNPDGWNQIHKHTQHIVVYMHTLMRYPYVHVYTHTHTNADNSKHVFFSVWVALTLQNAGMCSCVTVSGQDIQTITSTPRAKPWLHHEKSL